jgi:predicted nucleotidyltransferase
LPAPVAEYTRPATWEDVKRIAGFLEQEQVEYALIGGYALGIHGLVRATEDVDVLVNPSASNARRWIVALSRLPDGAARELAGDADVFDAQKRYAIRINDEITVDVMPAAAGLSWEELQPFIEEVVLDGVRLRVLSLEGLLKTKQGARPKDQADAAAIARALKQLGRG